MAPPGCSICILDFESDYGLQGVGSCGHVFHSHCLQQWFESSKHKKCPVCRSSCSKIFTIYLSSVGTEDSSQSKSFPSDLTNDVLPRQQDQTIEVTRLKHVVKSLQRQVDESLQKCTEKDEKIERLTEDLKVTETEKLEALRLHSALLEQTETSKLVYKTTVAKLESDLHQVISQKDDLEKKTMELEKIIAESKMSTDSNVDEAELDRLVQSLLKHRHSESVIRSLQQSLLERNRMYRELVGKCDQLGSQQKLTEKRSDLAVKRMKKLKSQVEFLEKENARLLSLKTTPVVTQKPFSNDNTASSSLGLHKGDQCPTRGRSKDKGFSITNDGFGEVPLSTKAFMDIPNHFNIVDVRKDGHKRNREMDEEVTNSGVEHGNEILFNEEKHSGVLLTVDSHSLLDSQDIRKQQVSMSHKTKTRLNDKEDPSVTLDVELKDGQVFSEGLSSCMIGDLFEEIEIERRALNNDNATTNERLQETILPGTTNFQAGKSASLTDEIERENEIEQKNEIKRKNEFERKNKFEGQNEYEQEKNVNSVRFTSNVETTESDVNPEEEQDLEFGDMDFYMASPVQSLTEYKKKDSKEKADSKVLLLGSRGSSLRQDPVVIRKEYGLSGPTTRFVNADRQSSGFDTTMRDHGLLSLGSSSAVTTFSTRRERRHHESIKPGHLVRKLYSLRTHILIGNANDKSESHFSTGRPKKKVCTNQSKKDSGMASIGSYFSKK